MAKNSSERPGIFESFIGLILAPGETTEQLFHFDPPPFRLGYLSLLFFSVLLPVSLQIYSYGYSPFDSDALTSLTIVLVLTLTIFFLAESLMLLLLGFRVVISRLLAGLAYATVPFTLSLWLIYIFNYLANGTLTLVTLLVTGASNSADPFLRVLPYALILTQILCLVVFFYSIRAMERLSTLSTAVITGLSLIPLYGSLLIALFCGDTVRPGTIAIFFSIIASPARLAGY